MIAVLATAIATVRPVAEYWLAIASTAMATVAELWRPAGLHRRGWREPSTFEFTGANWMRMARVVEAAPKPILTPLEAPKPPTIGERARLHGAADTQEFVRAEFARIVGVELTQLGTGSHRERRAAA